MEFSTYVIRHFISDWKVTDKSTHFYLFSWHRRVRWKQKIHRKICRNFAMSQTNQTTWRRYGWHLKRRRSCYYDRWQCIDKECLANKCVRYAQHIAYSSRIADHESKSVKTHRTHNKQLTTIFGFRFILTWMENWTDIQQ